MMLWPDLTWPDTNIGLETPSNPHSINSFLVNKANIVHRSSRMDHLGLSWSYTPQRMPFVCCCCCVWSGSTVCYSRCSRHCLQSKTGSQSHGSNRWTSAWSRWDLFITTLIQTSLKHSIGRLTFEFVWGFGGFLFSPRWVSELAFFLTAKLPSAPPCWMGRIRIQALLR